MFQKHKIKQTRIKEKVKNKTFSRKNQNKKIGVKKGKIRKEGNLVAKFWKKKL